MLDLGRVAFVGSCAAQGVTLNPLYTLAQPGSHLKYCQVCFEGMERRALPDFCFAHVRITGDSEQISDPRHPESICRTCLRRHCEAGLEGGRLFVQCPFPGCGRALQIRELKSHLAENVFAGLLERLTEAEAQEEANQQEEAAAELAGLELRRCPKCRVRIEKNQGCSSMRCYRCGEAFQWEQAALVDPSAQPAAQQAGGFSFGSTAAATTQPAAEHGGFSFGGAAAATTTLPPGLGLPFMTFGSTRRRRTTQAAGTQGGFTFGGTAAAMVHPAAEGGFTFGGAVSESNTFNTRPRQHHSSCQ